MDLVVCDYLDTIMILNCLEPGHFDVDLILFMWYDFKNILFTSGLMYSIRTSEEKLKIFFYTGSILLHCPSFFVYVSINLDYIVAIVACVSDVAHGHLFWGGFTLYFLMNSVPIKPPVLFFSSCSFLYIRI